jgi:hypothetical protein
MQLLEIVQRVVRRLPLSNAVTSVVGSSSALINQLLEIAQEEGDELQGKHEWQALQLNMTGAGAGGNPDSFPLPADWSRFRADASLWRSGSKLTPLSGPVSIDAWHRLLVLPGIRFPGYWRLEDNNLLCAGVPNGETISIPYVSTNWILDVDGVTTKAFWTADTDSPRVHERLIRTGMIWRWKQSKGLDYAEDLKTHELELERRIAADRTPRAVNLRNLVPPADLTETPYAWPGMVVQS